MKKLLLKFILPLAILFFPVIAPRPCASIAARPFPEAAGRIKIQWTENIPGDFSFTTKWSYPENIFKNSFGQLCCDGSCPETLSAMQDSVGRIPAASLQKYYRLFDTTHQFHTIAGTAWCYEWAGCDFIKAERISDTLVRLVTLQNAGTHCSLVLIIAGDVCTPSIELTGIASPGTRIYKCRNGSIKIDRKSWSKNIVKAEFSFNFLNTDEPGRKMFWNGKIFTPILYPAKQPD
jgi:hypothetical protein